MIECGGEIAMWLDFEKKGDRAPFLDPMSNGLFSSQLMPSTPLHIDQIPTVARFPAWPGSEFYYRKGPGHFKHHLLTRIH